MKYSGFPGLMGGMLAGILVACTGSVTPNDGATPGSPGSPTGTPSTPSNPGDPSTPTNPGTPVEPTAPTDPPPVTAPPEPVEPVAAASAVRKVKNLLTGLAPTDEEVARVTSEGAAGMQALIGNWMTTAPAQDHFREKMIGFFRNTFQQTGFTATEDFKLQMLENGGFDFGPFGTGAVGDDIYYRLVQNIEDSFAHTAWSLVAEQRPFSEVLTTNRYMMTTALKTIYLQIEMPNDQPFARFGGQDAEPTVLWHVDYGTGMQDGAMIDLPTAMGSLTFDDVAPTVTTGFGGGAFGDMICTGVRDFTGYAQLFQRLIGYTPRSPFSGNPDCFEHASRPYFEVGDTQDWMWVTVRPLADGEARIEPYDIPTLRTTSELGLALPRHGFYTTPAFLALWNTNDSNQHRVTVNQTLLVALGESFTSSATVTLASTEGLNGDHAVEGTECYGCHQNLDPMRQFWATQYDFNDRNDFPGGNRFTGDAGNPRPDSVGGGFAFRNMSQNGTMADLGNLLLGVVDVTDGLSRFALSMTQKLCYFANSSSCAEDDPEFRRLARAFQDNNYDFRALVVDLFSSPLVTGLASTATFVEEGMTVSISRRDQLCAALSNRLAKPDLCALAIPLPDQTQKGRMDIAGNIPADAFGRGSEMPVTPTEPTLFFRAASEMLCETIATLVVDAETETVYTSSDLDGGVTDMVARVIGYHPSDVHFAQAKQLLLDHYNAATADGANATNAMRSTFAAACQSPVSVSFGL